MPCIVRNLTDDEAITQMVEDNLNQREEILPSERAKALKMQLEAIKHQGSRTSGQIDPKDAGKRSNEIVAERNKMAVKQVQRYIRLNELVPDLMKLMDEKKSWALLRRWSFPMSAKRTRTISPLPLTASSPLLRRRRQSVCVSWTKRSWLPSTRGELKNSRKLASVLVKARAGQKITTIGEFLEVIKPLFGREREKKELAKVFQALRIEVNQEMEALKEMLYAATEALKPGGRLVVITYHSLEDRMVKNMMKTGNVEGKMEKDFFGNVQTPFRLVNNKVIVPDETEIERNPRSRSAKLRIAEKKGEE